MSFAAESMERLRLAHDRLHEVIRERDELLEALRKAKTCALSTEVRDVVDAAIAKATAAAVGPARVFADADNNGANARVLTPAAGSAS